MKYDLVICGGTFDRLHSGHKAFLKFAFDSGKRVIIGLTSDVYVSTYKKGIHALPFTERKKELEDFLQQNNVFSRAKISKIDTKFDETQIEEDGQIALAVSPETYPTGLEINTERKRCGRKPFDIIICNLVKDDSGDKISSTNIREGLIDREGVMLPSSDFISSTLFLPQSLRDLLSQPFGQLFEKEIPQTILEQPEKIISVGDATTERLHQLGIRPKFSVVDFFVERQKKYQSLEEIGFKNNENVYTIKNPAGELHPEVWATIQTIVRNFSEEKESVLFVDGEDDLVVIPLILILPLGYFIFYGQPKKGVVIIEITEAIKRKTFDILKQFIHH